MLKWLTSTKTPWLTTIKGFILTEISWVFRELLQKIKWSILNYLCFLTIYCSINQIKYHLIKQKKKITHYQTKFGLVYIFIKKFLFKWTNHFIFFINSNVFINLVLSMIESMEFYSSLTFLNSTELLRLFCWLINPSHPKTFSLSYVSWSAVCLIYTWFNISLAYFSILAIFWSISDRNYYFLMFGLVNISCNLLHSL